MSSEQIWDSHNVYWSSKLVRERKIFIFYEIKSCTRLRGHFCFIAVLLLLMRLKLVA
jgi:hypothetical protein